MIAPWRRVSPLHLQGAAARPLDVWETALHNPGFSEYARVCGALGIRVTTADQLDDAIARGLAYDGPALVEIVTDAELI